MSFGIPKKLFGGHIMQAKIRLQCVILSSAPPIIAGTYRNAPPKIWKKT